MRIQIALTEAEAHGLRDILDWLDIQKPADFTDEQLAGLECLLRALTRDKIERYFALGPNESAVDFLLARERRGVPLDIVTGPRPGEVVTLRWKDVDSGK